MTIGEKKRKSIWCIAVVVSFFLHLCLLLVALSIKMPLRKTACDGRVELTILESKTNKTEVATDSPSAMFHPPTALPTLAIPKVREPKHKPAGRQKSNVKRPLKTRAKKPTPSSATPRETDEQTGQILVSSQESGTGPLMAKDAPEGATKTGDTTVDPAKIDLNLNWSRFESTFGNEEKRAREVQDENQPERLRRKVQKAMSLRKGWVKPGNQEQLGADRKTAFAEFIQVIFKKIGPKLEGYIHGMDSAFNRLHRNFKSGPLSQFYKPAPTSEHADSSKSLPLGDFSLRTVTELEVLTSGKINDVKVVKTSGNAVFDAVCVSGVLQNTPLPPPPAIILSWNERAYFRWVFHRDTRKNRPSSVNGFILRSPSDNSPNN